MRRLPMPQVGADRAVPVDLRQPRPAIALAAVQGTRHRRAHRLLEPLHQFVDDLAHHAARRLLRARRNHPRQRHQVGHQVHVRLHALQHLRLQQHVAQVQTLQRVLLHHLHHRAREVLADVAQPARHARRGVAPPPAPVIAQTAVVVVERAQRLVHLRRVAVQRAAAVLRLAAEHQPPAAQAIRVVLLVRAAHASTPSIARSSGRGSAARASSHSARAGTIAVPPPLRAAR